MWQICNKAVLKCSNQRQSEHQINNRNNKPPNQKRLTKTYKPHTRVEKMKKLAVHLHIYYHEQIEEILQYLHNLPADSYDLYVTLTDGYKPSIQKLKQFNPATTIIKTENRGYDIGPFISFLHQIELKDYEYILKLHTKGKANTNYTLLNNNRLDNALWGKILWDSMLATPECLQQNLTILEEDKTIGMIGSKYCLTGERRAYLKLLPQINETLKRMNLAPQKSIKFIAGTMFIAKAKLLVPLKQIKITDFAITDGKIKEGTYAHVIERVFGAIINAQGYNIHGITHNNYSKMFTLLAIKRFFFQKKITSTGKQIIKICKIPVYSKKVEV